MNSDGKKDEIISKTKDLLLECDNVGEVTTRAIADRANINPAMVNYYFGSKDELLKKAIERILDIADGTRPLMTGTGNPRKSLFDFLISMCDRLLYYEKYSRIYVPSSLLNDSTSTPLAMVPVLKEYFNERKDENACKLIAYQMVSFLQLVIYCPKEFMEYSEIDVHNRNELRNLVSSQLDTFLGETL
jgi:AcrR family transcriptional regulator